MTNKKLALLLFAAALFLASFFSLQPAQAQTSYAYSFTGPYYYDGTVPYNGTVSLALLWVNGTTLRFNMTAVEHTANVTSVVSTTPVYQALWNASSALNYTSIIDFQSTVTSYNVNIYVPSPNTPSFIYTFIVTDFVGMTNPYLKCALSTDGETYNLLQQADLSAATDPAFVLAQYGTYQLTFLCDQGSYTQMFTAQNTYTTTLPVLSGAFPTTNQTYPTLYVERLNTTLVGISYVDPSNTTNWLYLNITHPSGSTTINDYNTNNTGNSQTILWNGADSDKNYVVYATANINITTIINGTAVITNTTRPWALIAPVTPNSNPFLGLFDFLGQTTDTFPQVSTGWPEGMTSLQIAQLIGAAIVMLFLCVGSFRSAGACCILSWAVAGVMMYLGWWGNSTTTYATVPMFVFAGFIGLIVHLGEAKQSERDV